MEDKIIDHLGSIKWRLLCTCLYWQTTCIAMWGYTPAVLWSAHSVSVDHWVWPHPFLDEGIWPSWLHEMKAHLYMLYWQTTYIAMGGYTPAVLWSTHTISVDHWVWQNPFLDEDIRPSWLHEMKAHLYMPVLADNMHSNVRLYTSSTLECSLCLCGSLGLTTLLPGWRYSVILAPWNEGSLVHACIGRQHA